MNEHETHSAVVKLARGELEEHERISCWFRPEFVRALIDRLEAAHKREVDALKQRLAELNAEVAAKDEVIKRLNDAIAEEQRRSGQYGNAAKMREAVGKILWCLKWMFDNTDDKSVQSHLGEPIALAKEALATPARNCDVGTAEERMRRYHALRREITERHEQIGEHNPPPFAYPTEFEWEDSPYESEAVK